MGCHEDPPDNASTPEAAGTSATTPKADPAALLADLPLAHVVSRDAQGRARFAIGASTRVAMPSALDGEQAARLQLARNARLLGVSEQVAQGSALLGKHQLPAGAAIYQFSQRSHGVEIFGARASVVLDADKHLVSLANRLSPLADDAPAQLQRHKWSKPELAIERAYALRAPNALPAGAVHPAAVRGEWRDFTVTSQPGQPRVIEAAAKAVFFQDGERLVPAYHVELLLRAEHKGAQNQAYGLVLAANDGRTLYTANLTASDAFKYRVWADATGHPTDGPLQDATPYPANGPEALQLQAAEPTLITTEGYNHNPDGKPDPWLASSATYTFGNNVRAYSDRDQFTDDAGVAHRDGFNEGDDLRADLTAPNTFDRKYDLSRAPDANDDQIKASITQLFYVNNWLHDYYYDSGFNEGAKNAQLSNYGRGGVEGDPLRAEAQDSADDGASNNANMSTFSDGRSPRMQMYVWSGLPNRALETSPPITIEDGLGAASFGPQEFDLKGADLTLVLADDGSTELPEGVTTGTGKLSDACQVPTNVDGKIAVIDRGICTFVAKALNAQEGGAIAIVLVDGTAGHSPPSPGVSDDAIKIPLLGVSFEDGAKLKAALGESTAPLRATRYFRGAETEHDGTIDNTVIAHEWGHYLHHRLVLCGSTSCDGMSEGWGDFTALMLVLRDSDVYPGKVYPLAQYASAGLDKRASYFGIRRAPYSVDLDKNPFTFKHVRASQELPDTAPLSSTSPDMNESHNVGEIWAETLFEAYVGVIEEGRAQGRPFDETKRRMTDYVVAGMKAAPVEPTFIEQRDAILASVFALSKSDASRVGDFNAIARAFAKRGLGVGAVAPPAESESLDEAEESFDVKGELGVTELALDDSVKSCDQDGILDAGESGKLSLKITNTGWVTLTQTTVQVTSRDADVELEGGGALKVASLQPYESVVLQLGLKVAAAKDERGTLRLVVKPSDPGAINNGIEQSFELRYNFDDVLASAASDDVESDKSAWTVKSLVGPTVWERDGDATNHVWHGADLGTMSDGALESPDLQVSADRDFVITFSHRYSFEIGPVDGALGPIVGFDGAVMELSSDGGGSWQDISEYADPDYTAKLFSVESLPDPGDDVEPEPDTNPLAGRSAWLGESEDYPTFTRVSLNLGRQLAGKTVRIRFRIGSDASVGDAGWDIDRIAFGEGSSGASSITNQPFSSVQDDATECADVTASAPAAP